MAIWKDKERGHWRFGFKLRGERHTGRGFCTRREAVTGQEQKRQEVLREQEQQPIPAVMGFRELASTYLDYSLRKHAKATYVYKKLTYKRFLDYQGDLPADSVTPILVHDFLNTLPSNRVYNAARKEISALYEYAINKLSLPLVNPCAKIDIMPHSPKMKRLPSEEEILKMILAARPGDEQDILMCCIHLLGRIDEILRLTWQDVNFEKRVVTLWTRKRKDGAYEPDEQPMNQDLYDVLKSRWEIRTQETWAFYNPDTETRYFHRPKMMASICKRAGITPIGKTKRRIWRGKKKGTYQDVDLYYGFHSLRHFMASHLVDQEKASLKSVSRLLRHKTLKTTEIYVHSIEESVRSTMGSVEGKFTLKSGAAHPKGTPEKEKEATEIP